MQRFLKLSSPIWTLRPLQKFAKASAFLRHPLNPGKRKAYRAQQLEALELGSYILLQSQPDSIFRKLNRRSQRPAPAGTNGPSETSHLAISAIIPNYNHARFLEERIRSILDQKLGVSELIILDDASTDDSKDVIQKIAASLPLPVTTVFNETNSGSIFSQWNKGLSLAKNELVWICESDDSCDADFLQELVPYFNDPSTMLAFGRVEYIDADGNLLQEMNAHFNLSRFWREPRIESAYAWFNGPFGVKNIIANVGGCVFRRQKISPALIAEAASYKICGDWFLYSRLAGSGRIAYEPSARAYFRQHGRNSSVISLKNESFYDEHIQIALALRRHYGVASSTLELLLQNAWKQCRSNLGADAARKFAHGNRLQEITREKRTVRHVVMTVPAHANADANSLIARRANELSLQGDDASIVVYETAAVSSDLRSLLAPNIPVFSKEILETFGPKSFLQKFGVCHVNAYAPGSDASLLQACDELRVPYSIETLNERETGSGS